MKAEHEAMLKKIVADSSYEVGYDAGMGLVLESPKSFASNYNSKNDYVLYHNKQIVDIKELS